MAASLKRRLTVSVIVIFIFSWLLSALVTTFTARMVLLRETDHILEGVLLVAESVGKSLAADPSKQLEKIFSEHWIPVASDTANQDGSTHYTILRLQNNLHIGTQGTPSMNIWAGPSQILVGENTPAFASPAGIVAGKASNQTIGGDQWRVMYRYDDESGIWYAAGVNSQQAPFDGTRLLLQMLAPLMFIIPLTVIALYYGIARGLYPLRRLAQAIELRRQRGSLDPVPAGSTPQELAPVVDSLNHLLARLTDTLENEMRFTANAAHELQTPLAAISAEVQLCRRLLTDPESREMMERIRTRTDRASHSVRQLLTLARLDPQDTLVVERLALFEMIQEVVSELGHIASRRGLELRFEMDESQILLANREALLILLRNLINNAFRYTPAGGMVRFHSSVNGLLIENESPPVEELAHLADRFHRGNREMPGTGLGLSIVKRICELHGFTVILDYRESDGQFAVQLVFR